MHHGVLRNMSIGAAALVMAATVGSAQTPSTSQGAASRPAYRPGLGDLMVGSIQPRHIKLAAAGREKNWSYASYEIHELQESFDRVSQNFPQSGSFPIADMMTAATKGPMADLATSITDKDAAKFTAAFAELTDGCNSCHQATNRAMVVIKVPDSASFPDQDFAPAKP
jgi:hypothetical protein